MRRIRRDSLLQILCFRNFFHARNGHGSKQMVISRRKNQSCMLWIFVMFVGLHAIWNKLPVSHNFKIPPDTELWGQTDFLNDDCGRLTWTEPLLRGVRVAVIDPFFITCDNSLYKSIIHGIADKMTDIHSTFSLLRCQLMRYRSTASI